MNQTANFGLSQWAMEDQIMMKDFNSDNAKIDSALKSLSTAIEAVANSSPIQKLMDITTMSAATQIDLDLTQLGIPQYRELDINLQLPGNTAMDSCAIRCNGLSSGYLKGASFYDSIGGIPFGGNSDFSSFSGFHLWLGREIMGRGIFGYRFNGTNTFYDSSANTCSTINLSPSNLWVLNMLAYSGTFPAGTQIKLYGVKL